MKKAAVKKVGSNEAERRIFEYLQTTNRPYSAVDIFNNLKQEIGKTAVQKTLATLSASNEITCKTYGKQQVFVARQDLLDCPSAEELEELDSEIIVLKQQVEEGKENVRSLQSTLSGLTSALTNEQMEERILLLEKENAKYEDRLLRLRQGTELVDEKEKKRIESQYDEYRKQWRVRKKLCKDIVDTISEATSMRPKEFMEQLDLETDEAAGQDFNQEYAVFMPDE